MRAHGRVQKSWGLEIEDVAFHAYSPEFHLSPQIEQRELGMLVTPVIPALGREKQRTRNCLFLSFKT